MRVIDIHAHFIAPELIADARAGRAVDGLSLAAAEEGEQLVHRQGYRYPLTAEFHDPAARLRAMDVLGIDGALVSVSPTCFFYWVEPRAGTDEARRTNDAIAAHVAHAPERLAGLATLPMQAPAAAADELERAVTQLGFAGASIGPRVDEAFLDDPRCWPVLERAEALDVPLLLHPFYVGLRDGLPDFYLTNLVGNPLETTIGASRLILSGVLDRFPRLRLALTHGGGFLPYQVGRLDHGARVRPEAKGSAQPPSAYLRRFVYDTVTHHPGALDYLVGLVGADRVAYGTDLPFDMMAGSFRSQVPPALGDDDRDWIGARTAREWFGVFPDSDIRPAAAPTAGAATTRRLR